MGHSGGGGGLCVCVCVTPNHFNKCKAFAIIHHHSTALFALCVCVCVTPNQFNQCSNCEVQQQHYDSYKLSAKPCVQYILLASLAGRSLAH